jgi:hypothetical protein
MSTSVKKNAIPWFNFCRIKSAHVEHKLAWDPSVTRLPSEKKNVILRFKFCHIKIAHVEHKLAWDPFIARQAQFLYLLYLS